MSHSNAFRAVNNVNEIIADCYTREMDAVADWNGEFDALREQRLLGLADRHRLGPGSHHAQKSLNRSEGRLVVRVYSGPYSTKFVCV